jgi:hypothetical protein
MPREILQEELRLTLKDQEHQTRAQVLRSHKRVSCVMFKMRKNVLNLYQSMTFQLKYRSLKQPTRLTIKFTLFLH